MITGFVRGQDLTVRSPLIAADSIDYLTAQFVFQTSDWDGCRKFSHWKCGESNYTIGLENDRIEEEKHLNLTAGTWTVWIHGERYRDGELIQRITTDEAKIDVKSTGSADGSPFPETPASDIEQIRAEIAELRELVGSGTGTAGIVVEDDGAGNVTIKNAVTGEQIEITDDSEGNLVIGGMA